MTGFETNEVNQPPRDRALRLPGRTQALSEVHEMVTRFIEPMSGWLAFDAWLDQADAQVAQELNMLKAARPRRRRS